MYIEALNTHYTEDDDSKNLKIKKEETETLLESHFTVKLRWLEHLLDQAN